MPRFAGGHGLADSMHVGPIGTLFVVSKPYTFSYICTDKKRVTVTLFWVLQKPIEHSILWRHMGNDSTAPSALLKFVGTRWPSHAHLFKYIAHTSILGLG